MSKVLITGCAGFIGMHLARILLNQGNQVIGIDNFTPYYDINLKKNRLKTLNKEKNFTFLQGDITSENFLRSVLANYTLSSVVHLAAQPGVRYSFVDPPSYIKNNYVGTFCLLNIFKDYPINHFLMASSSSVYGNNNQAPFKIHHNTDEPISLYAATKKGTETLAYTYAHCYKLPITVLRFFTVYGPWGRPDMAVYSFTEKIIKEESLDIYDQGRPLRDYTYIMDIVLAISKLLETPATPEYKVYNIGNNAPESVQKLVQHLETLIGKKAIINHKPLPTGDVHVTCADISALKDKIGFSPATPLRVGLEKFIEWYRNYHNL
jgi:UDP-glucuronate 4-epimerase